MSDRHPGIKSTFSQALFEGVSMRARGDDESSVTGRESATDKSGQDLQQKRVVAIQLNNVSTFFAAERLLELWHGVKVRARASCTHFTPWGSYSSMHTTAMLFHRVHGKNKKGWHTNFNPCVIYHALPSVRISPYRKHCIVKVMRN